MPEHVEPCRAIRAEQTCRRERSREGERVWDDNQPGKEIATREHQKCTPTHDGELSK